MTVPRELTAALVSLAAVFLAAGALFSPAAAQLSEPSQPEPTRQSGAAPVRGAGRNPRGTAIRVLLSDGQVQDMELDAYIEGVVGGEMPALWPLDALKAQAVAARTYALQQAQAGKHAAQNADVCADSTCCQAYQTLQFLRDSWGGDADFYQEKLHQAVAETQGEVLTYDGALISAVYHASSAGATNAAADVWGKAVPYLISVDTLGTEVKGHGVGMSQWGARYLAEEGRTYQEILAHYYPGTALERR